MNTQLLDVSESKELLTLYLHQEYEQLSEKIIKILKHFENTTYIELSPENQYNINFFLKNFLYLFTQPDYVLSDGYLMRFIELNPTISNLVAMSNLNTTDVYLSILIHQPNNFAKILALYSARNSLKFNYKVLFDADSRLASCWYSYFAEIYRYGLVNKQVYQNLREHLNYKDDRLTDFYQITNLYFGSTYIDNSFDREIKQKINQTIKNSHFCKSAKIKNKPSPKQVAVITSVWFPGHSVYRTLCEFVESLKDDYEITLVHLGEKTNDHELSFFKEIKYIDVVDNHLNIESIRENNFMVVYYPDVGMNQESIFLSNLRLAPIQICGTGHPVSTFGSQIDYFISGVDVEIPKGAELNYSERLVLLPGYGLIHKQPDYQIQNIQKSRKEFIINCAWYAHKINYDLISCLKKIIKQSKKDIIFRFFVGHILLQKNGVIPLVKDLEALLGKEHFNLVLNQPYDDYMALMEEGDICIESYHFGGSNIIVDGLWVRKPTVTFEGDKWYNRIGSMMLREVGLEELIATTKEEYISLTLKLIHDEQYRKSVEEKLKHVDLSQTIFSTDNKKYFKKAIDYLIQNHEQLKRARSRKPLLIS
jgi:predicted O-linked N-acetylglucosamine transferase (SPINDLY family)